MGLMWQTNSYWFTVIPPFLISQSYNDYSPKGGGWPLITPFFLNSSHSLTSLYISSANKRKQKVMWHWGHREEWSRRVTVTYTFLYSRDVSHTVQSKQLHVSSLDRLWRCDPSKNEWGVIITWQALGWAHLTALLKVIFTHNHKSFQCSRESGSPQWKRLTERL